MYIRVIREQLVSLDKLVCLVRLAREVNVVMPVMMVNLDNR